MPEDSPRQRHRWDKGVLVEVEWDPLPRHLYTCLRCGTKKQHVPSGAFYVAEFTLPGGAVVRGKAPACEAPA